MACGYLKRGKLHLLREILDARCSARFIPIEQLFLYIIYIRYNKLIK
jgi:hypothetical protein